MATRGQVSERGACYSGVRKRPLEVLDLEGQRGARSLSSAPPKSATIRDFRKKVSHPNHAMKGAGKVGQG